MNDDEKVITEEDVQYGELLDGENQADGESA